MSEQWCLLWSKRQNALHIEPLERTLSINRQRYRDDEFVNDYLPILIGDRKEVDAAADACRSTMAERAFYGEPLKVAV